MMWEVDEEDGVEELSLALRSLSPRAPLASLETEDEEVTKPTRTENTFHIAVKDQLLMTVILGNQGQTKKESSDSGKESSDSESSEEKQVDEEGDEIFEDCEDFEARTDFGWSCLDTIEEEEEDSGNDSDLEKSELEQFEQLEQLCEQEIVQSSNRKEELLREPTIKSYHDYKKLLNQSERIGEYRNQVVVEKKEEKMLIRPAEPGKDSNVGGRCVGSIGEEECVRGETETAEINRAVSGGGPMKHEPESKPKSALKRASSKKRKKYKVQFDESLNKFFEADYVILIREECGGGDCDCGGGDYCYAEQEDEEEEELRSLDLTPFDPPVEFVDQLTLSPPDGYKDYCIQTFPEDSECQEEWRHDGGEAAETEDGTTQTTPTNEEEHHPHTHTHTHPHTHTKESGGEKKERYIVETITMTTVTERRIIRESEAGAGEEGAGAAQARETCKDKEMTLTFKLGSNSLKPNSALRQLFPRIASPPPDKSPDSDDDSLQSNLIKRTIERNTLRRSLVRYPDLRKRNQTKKNENSLVERIKKLTCDIDEEERSSPSGEESKEEKVPAYRKITDIFIRSKEHPLQTPASVEHQYPYYQPYNPPDLGNGPQKPRVTSESRKQFLSSLAPLTACVSGEAGSRDSTTSADTEYSLNDIDDVLKNDSKPQPDIVVGTPGNETNDELALFVQQDASRIERLKKRYSSGSDDEHDDYGFNRRPSVRGIKPRFGSTTEILQQMQSQIAAPLPSGSHVSWPYYGPTENGYGREPGCTGGPVPYVVPPRQVVVRGTQTISTYYQLPRYPGRGPLLYYPARSPPVCSSPTKLKLERGVPEGASSSPHQELVLPPPPPPHPQAPDTMMYAMNV